MAKQQIYSIRPQVDKETTAFVSAEEAWFWFVQAQLAKESGARITMGKGNIPRPCEPIDILRILDRLYRTRRLLMDHIHVLKHYGLRQMRPDADRVKEMRASTLWDEAMLCLSLPLINKGIVSAPLSDFMEAAE